MNRRIVVALLFLVALAQLAVPSWMILSQEQILHRGRVFKLKTAPVDPYDFFRGRYVALSFEQERATWLAGDWKSGDVVYALLAEGTDGMARVTQITKENPHRDDAFECKVRWVNGSDTTLQFPFDRYYAEESKAPRIEADYRANSRGERANAYVTIRVFNGKAALEDLYVDGLPIREYYKQAKPR